MRTVLIFGNREGGALIDLKSSAEMNHVNSVDHRKDGTPAHSVAESQSEPRLGLFTKNTVSLFGFFCTFYLSDS